MTRSGGVKGILRPPEVRGANRTAVLRLLQHNGYLSRADVARESGLSEGAISRIVNGLIEDGLVREDGAENTTGGRPGRRLALEPRRVVFGADVQNWETRCAVSTMQGRIVSTKTFRTPPSLDETLELVCDTFVEFRKELGSDRLPGAGICLRGIVNRDTGTLVYGSRPEWKNVQIRQALEQRLREPVIVENNVRAAALAEYTYGNSEFARRRCFIFLGVDEGVGMAVLFDGKLYHGPHMAAGECGEMIIRDACVTGSAGNAKEAEPRTVEELVSNGAICRRYADLTAARRQVATGDTTARVRKIVDAARAGDAQAHKTLLETAQYLGIAIANIVWSLDADSVVVDGAIAAAWPMIHEDVQKQLPDYHKVWGTRNLLLRASSLGGEAALIGAATLPLSLVFTHGPEARVRTKAVR